MISGIFFALSVVMTSVFLWRYVRLSFGVSSCLLGAMLLLHGPAYWYYSRYWNVGKGWLFDLYSKAWPSAGKEAHVSGNYFYDQIQNANFKVLDIALAITFLALCCGIWLADVSFKNGPKEQDQALKRWLEAPLCIFKQESHKWLTGISILSVLFLFYFMIRDNQLSNIYQYFSAEAGEFEKIKMRREFGGSSSYFFNLLLGNGLTFLAFYFWVLIRDGNFKFVQTLLSGVLIFLVFTAKIAMLSKSPAVIFAFQFLVVEVMRRRLSLNVKHIVLISSLPLLLLILMVFASNSGIGGVLQSLIFIFYRAFMIPNESIAEYFLVFPDKIPYTWGRDIGLFAEIFGWEPLKANYWRVSELLRGAKGSTTTAMFMADAWAAFSWGGIVVVPLFFGFFVRWIDIELIVKRGRSYASIAGLGLGHYGIWIALSTAFQTALLTGGLAFILLLVIVFELFTTRPTLSKEGDRGK